MERLSLEVLNKALDVMETIKNCCGGFDDSFEECKYEFLKQHKQYLELKEQGRLLELPCKLGDTTYWISDEDNEGNKVLTVRENNPIVGISIAENGLYILADGDDEHVKVGTRWAYLTREEAEEALKRMEDGNETD